MNKKITVTLKMYISVILLVISSFLSGQDISMDPNEININGEILIQSDGGPNSNPVIKFVNGSFFREIGTVGGDKIGIDGDVIPYSSTSFDLGNNVTGENWDQVVCNTLIELTPTISPNIKSKPISGALNRLMNLSTYSYKSSGGNSSFVFDLKSLRKHLPEVVISTDYDVEISELAPGKSMLSGIKVSAFTPIIIEAMKEQQSEIVALRELVLELKEELKLIKKDLKSTD